jgi:hypothetical protein
VASHVNASGAFATAAPLKDIARWDRFANGMAPRKFRLLAESPSDTGTRETALLRKDVFCEMTLNIPPNKQLKLKREYEQPSLQRRGRWNIRMLVFLASQHDLFRQTPGGRGVWGGLQFTSDPVLGQTAPWLFVHNEPGEAILSQAPLERRILFVTEPPTIRKYPPRYTNQFGIAISPPDLKKFRGLHIRSQPCLNWMFGLDGAAIGEKSGPLCYDDLASLSFQNKRHAVSVICSKRQGTEQHNKRLAFVKALQEKMGDTLHWFGHGFNPVHDKAEAIIPYRFHIVLENNTIPHFWTEKLADAYLGDCFPIVAGGDCLENYFSTDSFERIDLDNIDTAVAAVVDIVNRDLWAQRYAAIRESRRRLLEEHNLFAVCERHIKSHGTRIGKPYLTKVKPVYSPRYRKFRQMRKRVRHKLRDAFPYGIF